MHVHVIASVSRIIPVREGKNWDVAQEKYNCEAYATKSSTNLRGNMTLEWPFRIVLTYGKVMLPLHLHINHSFG